MTPQATLVYLVRHGLTDWNAQKRFQGQLNIPLNDEGLQQAAAVAGWLAKQPVSFAALYSSDLTRAAQTAQAIGAALQLEPQLTDQLREINCGDWQGLSIEEVEERYPGQLAQWREQVNRFRLPGGESIPEVQTRTFAFYSSAVQKHIGAAIVIVSHGAALSALQTAIHGWNLLETWNAKQARMGNTGVTVISTHSNGKVSVVMHNSMEHLDEPKGMATVLDPSV